MKTPLGNYLKKLNSTRSKIASVIQITEDRLNALSNEDTAVLYADELYQILYVANYYAGIPVDKFDDCISEIFPNRMKSVLIAEFDHLSPAAKLFLKYTQSKSKVEKAIGMPQNKISKFATGSQKRATALEFINFCDGMNLNLLDTFKELFGEIQL